MPSINMIAARRMEKRRQAKNIRHFAYVIAGEVGITVMVASVLALRWTSLSIQSGEMQNELHKIQPTVDHIQQMEKDTEAMEPKVTTLAGARADTLFWYSGFYAVSSALPPQSWLTSLSTGGSTDGAAPGTVAATDPQLNLNGVAMSESQVGTVMEQMNRLPCLDHVDLISLDQQKSAKGATVSFQMTVHLKPEAAPTDDATPGGASNA